MMKWAMGHPLPENLDELIGPEGVLHGVTRDKKLYAIPVPYEKYPETDAICLTGLTELGWIFQLVNSTVRYSLHIDGKHKLHHGKWMLVTIGCHDLALDKDDRNEIVHSYRPLVYMFVKQQETTESVKLLCESVNFVAKTCFGADEGLLPGIVNMDHSDGFRNGTLSVWNAAGTYRSVSHRICLYRTVSTPYRMDSPIVACTHTRICAYLTVSHPYRLYLYVSYLPGAGINTCWPHLKRKVGQGEYLSKEHEFYATLNEIMVSIHFSQTYEMMELLIMQGGDLMHETTQTERKLRALWNEYFVEPWNCWCFNLHMSTPCDISNNNPIESWHRVLMTMLRKALKGSTASVLGHTFPKVMNYSSITVYRTCMSCIARFPYISRMYHPYVSPVSLRITTYHYVSLRITMYHYVSLTYHYVPLWVTMYLYASDTCKLYPTSHILYPTSC